MDKWFYNIGLLFASTLLIACPYSSTHALDDTQTIYVDTELLGSWATFVTKPASGKQEPIKLIVGKLNDTEYSIAFTGKINELKPYRVVQKDTIHGTAFMSTVADKQFLNIRIKETVFLAEIILKDGMLSLLPLSEHFTAKMVMNNADLRNCVEIHYRTRVRPLYDDDFCLKQMIKVK